MRELVLQRIEEIRKRENNFKNKSRWGLLSSGTIKADADEIEYADLNDYELILIFERMIKRYYAQM